MASDEAMKEAALHNHWAEKCVCWPNCSRCQTLASLLDRMMAKARLEATKRWGEHEEIFEGTCGVHMPSHCALCQELAELERLAGRGK